MGCGWGWTTLIVAQELADTSRVVAIDTSLERIGIAEARRSVPNIDFVAMDAAQTGFRGATFDKVVIAHLLHGMGRGKRRAVLREARRVLGEGGRVGVVEVDWPSSPLMRLYFNAWWHWWRPWRFQQATRRDMLRHGIAEELREAGFRRVRKVTVYHGGIQVVMGEKPGGRGPAPRTGDRLSARSAGRTSMPRTEVP